MSNLEWYFYDCSKMINQHHIIYHHNTNFYDHLFLLTKLCFCQWCLNPYWIYFCYDTLPSAGLTPAVNLCTLVGPHGSKSYSFSHIHITSLVMYLQVIIKTWPRKFHRKNDFHIMRNNMWYWYLLAILVGISSNACCILILLQWRIFLLPCYGQVTSQ